MKGMVIKSLSRKPQEKNAKKTPPNSQKQQPIATIEDIKTINTQPVIKNTITPKIADYINNSCYFSDGEIYSKNGQRLTTTRHKQEGNDLLFIRLFNNACKFESILWFASSNNWTTEFQYIDKNPENKIYENIAPIKFPCKKLKYSKQELLNFFDIHEDGFFWYAQKNKSPCFNTLMPYRNALKIINNIAYVDIFGEFYLAAELILTINDREIPDEIFFINGDKTDFRIENICEKVKKTFQSDDENPIPIDSDPFINTEDNDQSFGRNAVISCFYCGDNSSITRDHVIPTSYTSNRRSYNPKDVVPCCQECNSILSNKSYFTVESRAAYLAEQLAKRYKKTIESYPYTATEIKSCEFGKRLGQIVAAGINQRSFIVSRIDHCHKVAKSLYKESEVSHLRGLTTDAKQRAYRILEDYVFDREATTSEFCKQRGIELHEDESIILKILNEKIHIDVVIQFKHDYRYPFDVSIHKIRKLLIENSIFKNKN